MGAFLIAAVTAVVIAVAAYFVLEQLQVGSDVANTTAGTQLTIEKQTR